MPRWGVALPVRQDQRQREAPRERDLECRQKEGEREREGRKESIRKRQRRLTHDIET